MENFENLLNQLNELEKENKKIDSEKEEILIAKKQEKEKEKIEEQNNKKVKQEEKEFLTNVMKNKRADVAEAAEADYALARENWNNAVGDVAIMGTADCISQSLTKALTENANKNKEGKKEKTVLREEPFERKLI